MAPSSAHPVVAVTRCGSSTWKPGGKAGCPFRAVPAAAGAPNPGPMARMASTAAPIRSRIAGTTWATGEGVRAALMAEDHLRRHVRAANHFGWSPSPIPRSPPPPVESVRSPKNLATSTVICALRPRWLAGSHNVPRRPICTSRPAQPVARGVGPGLPCWEGLVALAPTASVAACPMSAWAARGGSHASDGALSARYSSLTFSASNWIDRSAAAPHTGT